VVDEDDRKKSELHAVKYPSAETDLMMDPLRHPAQAETGLTAQPCSKHPMPSAGDAAVDSCIAGHPAAQPRFR
jgi:hypothetical protein